MVTHVEWVLCVEVLVCWIFVLVAFVKNVLATWYGLRSAVEGGYVGNVLHLVQDRHVVAHVPLQTFRPGVDDMQEVGIGYIMDSTPLAACPKMMRHSHMATHLHVAMRMLSLMI